VEELTSPLGNRKHSCVSGHWRVQDQTIRIDAEQLLLTQAARLGGTPIVRRGQPAKRDSGFVDSSMAKQQQRCEDDQQRPEQAPETSGDPHQ
jgi:hypothetical protein